MNNEFRASRAEAALEAYVKAQPCGDSYGGESLQDIVQDFLADLLHSAAQQGDEIDLEKAIRVAVMNYEAE